MSGGGAPGTGPEPTTPSCAEKSLKRIPTFKCAALYISHGRLRNELETGSTKKSAAVHMDTIIEHGVDGPDHPGKTRTSSRTLRWHHHNSSTGNTCPT